MTDKPEPTPGVPADARSDASEEAVVLDLYKLAVEMADRVSARRTTANNFFLALHGSLAAVVALIGTQSSAGPQDGTSSSIVPMTVVGAAGILLCAAWWLGLRSYRDLNSAKFQVITKLEERLPAAVFSTEWKFLKRDEIPWWRGRYAEQGTVERVVPFIFMALYAFAIWRTMTG